MLSALSGCLSPIHEEVEKGLPEAKLPWAMASSGHSLAWVARVCLGPGAKLRWRVPHGHRLAVHPSLRFFVSALGLPT